MSDVAADALVDKGEILVEYAKPYGLNRTPNGNLASLGIMIIQTCMMGHYVSLLPDHSQCNDNACSILSKCNIQIKSGLKMRPACSPCSFGNVLCNV